MACDGLFYDDVRIRLKRALDLCEHLARTYSVVVANPPYMGSSNFDPWTSAWIKKNYPDVKSDLCTCFIERGFSLTTQCGYSAMVTMEQWMFLSSFEKMRTNVIDNHGIVSMAHIFDGRKHSDTFSANTSFVLSQNHFAGKSPFLRLSMMGDDAKAAALKEAIQTPACPWFYRADASAFKDIPGTPIAYWASESMRRAFRSNVLGDYANTSLGMATCDNDRFLRLWWEVDDSRRSIPGVSIDFNKKWFPYNKGGCFRKWYGNDDYLLNWEDNGAEVRSVSTAIGNTNRFFRQMVSWTRVSSGSLHARFKSVGYLFDMTGPAAFADDKDILLYCLAYLNSSIGLEFARFLSASLDFQPGQVASYPLLIKDLTTKQAVAQLSDSNCGISRRDYVSFETSWDFKRHPLV